MKQPPVLSDAFIHFRIPTLCEHEFIAARLEHRANRHSRLQSPLNWADTLPQMVGMNLSSVSPLGILSLPGLRTILRCLRSTISRSSCTSCLEDRLRLHFEGDSCALNPIDLIFLDNLSRVLAAQCELEDNTHEIKSYGRNSGSLHSPLVAVALWYGCQGVRWGPRTQQCKRLTITGQASPGVRP